MLTVSIIIPIWNEEESIHHLISGLIDLTGKITNSEVIFVGNSEKLKYYSNNKNFNILIRSWYYYPVPTKNAAEAILFGIERAKGRYIATFDADMTYDIYDLYRLINIKMRKLRTYIISGNRLSFNNYGMTKFHIKIKRLMAFFFNLKYKTNLADINCGLRVYNSKFLKENKWTSDMGFWFETYIKAKDRILEYPIRYYARIFGKSSVNRIRLFLKYLWMIIIN